MSTEIIFKFPERIRLKEQEEFEKIEKMLEKACESDKDLSTLFSHPEPKKPKLGMKSEILYLQTFLNSLKNQELKEDFIKLIETFEDLELYKRFLASILIYNRIDGLPDGIDKFLYLCIAVEAAMYFKHNKGKKKNKLFRSFFKKNLSDESKLKMISNFRNKKVKNILVRDIKFGSKLKKRKTNTLLPSCYRQKHCFVYGNGCYPENMCHLKNEGRNKIDEQLDHILNYLYAKRGNFVHEGVGFSLENRDEKGYFDIRIFDLYKDHTKNKMSEVLVTLNMEQLFNFYEEALLNHCKTR